MIAKTVKVTDKGQISIPTSIRKSIGIEKGDELIIIEESGKIYLEKINNLAKNVIDDFSDLKKMSENSLKEVWDNEEDKIWEEYIK